MSAIQSNLQPSVQPAPATRRPVIEARALIKTFGSVVGLDAADFDLYPGEVLAVIGDNGAGKSTLIKCLSGATIPDAGEILIEGQPVVFRRPQDARAAGIETVYQSLAVVPALDIASNMFLGREIRRQGPLGSIFRMLDHGQMRGSSSWTSGSARSRRSRRRSRPCPAGSAKRSRSPGPRPSAAR